jgi:hypothetical protein
VARGRQLILRDHGGGSERAAAAERTTLDDLFRRAGVRNPDTLALVDPPNRESFTTGAPRRLAFAEADRAISALAMRLRHSGLQTDMAVAIQLPNTVESVIAFLGVLRAGMIAVPLPLLWRQQEMVAALRMIGAKAIITTSRMGSETQPSPAEVVIHVAADLFPIRYICGFGGKLPDGVVALDDIFSTGPTDFTPPSVRQGNAADHVAAITFDIGTDGLRAVARNHHELIAGGRAVFLESSAAAETPTLSTIPIGSFAGLALTVGHWLLSGGTLSLHHGLDPETLATQCRMQERGTLILPGPVLAQLSKADGFGAPDNIVAHWRSPECIASGTPWRGTARLTDIAIFGEVGFVAGRRGVDGRPLPIPNGKTCTPRDAAGAVLAIETLRSGSGMLALRGPMVPTHAFPPDLEIGPKSGLTPDALGFVDTGYLCRIEHDSQTLVLDSAPAGITTVGGYRFKQNQIDWLVTEADLDAVIVPLPDAYLGTRLAGRAPNPTAMAALLQAGGANPLISGAFRPRSAA